MHRIVTYPLGLVKLADGLIIFTYLLGPHKVAVIER